MQSKTLNDQFGPKQHPNFKLVKVIYPPEMVVLKLSLNDNMLLEEGMVSTKYMTQLVRKLLGLLQGLMLLMHLLFLIDLGIIIKIQQSDHVAITSGGTAMIQNISTRRQQKLIVQQVDHLDYFTCISFDPNSQFVATGSFDTSVKLWDIQTGKKISQFIGHHHKIINLQFNSVGDKLLTCSFDNARIWDVRSGDCIHILDQHTDQVRCAKFDVTGDYCATGSDDQTCKIWETKTGKYIKTLTGHTQGVINLSFNTQGSKIVTISEEDTGRVYNVQTGEFLTELQNFKHGLNLQYLRSKNVIIAEGRDYYTRIYSETGELLQVLGNFDEAIYCYSANYNGDILVTSLGFYGRLQIWKDINK